MKTMSVTSDDLRIVSEKLASTPRFGFDFETTSYHNNPDAPLHFDKLEVAGFSLGFPDGSSTYVPIGHSDNNAPTDQAYKLIRTALTDRKKEAWAHNLQFDWMVARTIGVDPTAKMRCSMIAQFLLGKKLSGGMGLRLKPAVKEYLGHTMIDLSDVLPGKTRAHEVSGKTMAPYAADDALQCLRLGDYYRSRLKESGMWELFTDLDCAFVPVLIHMFESGLAIDPNRLQVCNEELSAEMQIYSNQFTDLVGVSGLTNKPIQISSSPQVSSRLYEELRWWPTLDFVRGKSGRYSVNKKHLDTLSRSIGTNTVGKYALDLKRTYASLSTINSTFTLSLVTKANAWDDGRLRPVFSQTRTATGRLACSKPNVQNIPSRGEWKKIRRAFVANEGWKLGVCDYSQADLRMMGHLSCDTALIQAYLSGRDIHAETAAACGCSRQDAKTINFGLIYEMHAKALSAELHCSVNQAQNFINRYFGKYPGVLKYHDKCHMYALRNGYVKTITGRRRYIENLRSDNWSKRMRALREASNTPDQGSVADVIKIAMRNLYHDWHTRGVLYDYRNPSVGKAKIISQVHDEIICELRDDFVEEGRADITRHMETAVELKVPMVAECDIGDNWLEGKG